jgi:hypothetical protein
MVDDVLDPEAGFTCEKALDFDFFHGTTPPTRTRKASIRGDMRKLFRIPARVPPYDACDESLTPGAFVSCRADKPGSAKDGPS